jgi:adenylate kinase
MPSSKKLIVLFGPPGSGKGTQAHEMEKEGYTIVSSGNSIREFIGAKHTNPEDKALSKKLKQTIDGGNLIDFENLKLLIAKKLEKDFAEDDIIILEGVPRQPEQAQWIVDLAKEFSVEIIFIHLLVPLSEVIKRIQHRYFVPGSNTPYSSYEEAKAESPDGIEPIRRADDTAETVTKRYELQYTSVVDDILDILYFNDVRVVEVDATLGVKAIHAEIERYL